VERFGPAPAGETAGLPSRSSSTACRKLTPSTRITQSITDPPVEHAPMQCHRFFAGVTTKLGSESSWNGQHPTRSLPTRRSSMPRAFTNDASDTSVFSRSISASGTLATPPSEKILDSPRVATGYAM